jgi:hypothetical protein
MAVCSSVSLQLSIIMVVFHALTVFVQNVIGIKRGSRFPNEVVVVGGHYDSTSPVRFFALAQAARRSSRADLGLTLFPL